jgi:hypothetical protein
VPKSTRTPAAIAAQHPNPLDTGLRHLAERASSARVRLWAAALLQGESAEIVPPTPTRRRCRLADREQEVRT